MTKLTTLVMAAAFLCACGDDDGAAGTIDAGTTVPIDAGNPLVNARPYELNVPSGYQVGEPAPLLVLLHGYSATGFIQVRYMGMLDASEKYGFLVAYPEGLMNSEGKQYWNATDACCDVDDTGNDDVAYLSALIDDVEARYTIDPKRVYLIGHSNGGYMSHRMACDVGERIAAIISLAGMTWKDASKCPAADEVNVLQVHGTEDETVDYLGSDYYPSAPQTVATWAAKNGCTGALAGDTTADLDIGVAGAETMQQSYAGCPVGGAVDLWTIQGGSHIPSFEPTKWSDEVWAWFEAHPKP